MHATHCYSPSHVQSGVSKSLCRLWLTRVQNSCNSRGVLPAECTICKQPNGNSLTLTTSNTSYSCWIRLSPLDQYKITPHTTNYSSLHQRGEKKTKTKQTQSQKAAKREFCTIIFTRIFMEFLVSLLVFPRASDQLCFTVCIMIRVEYLGT